MRGARPASPARAARRERHALGLEHVSEECGAPARGSLVEHGNIWIGAGGAPGRALGVAFFGRINHALRERSARLDHRDRRILATAIGRLRGKIKYRPVVFELMPECFTLLDLQKVVEALLGLPLHKQNFRRSLDRSGLVEGLGVFTQATGGRPAELFRFRRAALQEGHVLGVQTPRG